MSEPVDIQVAVRILKRKSGRPISKEVIREAVKIWACTGKPPIGFEITSVSWNNYEREKGERIAEDEESIEEARRTLHLCELFQEIKVVIRKVGRGKAKGRSKLTPVRHRREKAGNEPAKKANARPKKSKQRHSHAASKRRMGAGRKVQRRKGIPRHRKNKGKPRSGRTNRNRGNLRKRSSKGKA